jgi:hypothetical protein
MPRNTACRCLPEARVTCRGISIANQRRTPPAPGAPERCAGASSFHSSVSPSSLEPLLRARPAMRTARPTTRTTFARLKFLDRALDSAAARCFLFGRDDPTNPFVPRQRRQILPSRLRLRFRVERHVQVCRSFVHGTGLARLALVHRFIVIVPGT